MFVWNLTSNLKQIFTFSVCTSSHSLYSSQFNLPNLVERLSLLPRKSVCMRVSNGALLLFPNRVVVVVHYSRLASLCPLFTTLASPTPHHRLWLNSTSHLSRKWQTPNGELDVRVYSNFGSARLNAPLSSAHRTSGTRRINGAQVSAQIRRRSESKIMYTQTRKAEWWCKDHLEANSREYYIYTLFGVCECGVADDFSGGCGTKQCGWRSSFVEKVLA